MRRIDFLSCENGFELCIMHKENGVFFEKYPLHQNRSSGIMGEMEGEICEIFRFLPLITVYPA